MTLASKPQPAEGCTAAGSLDSRVAPRPDPLYHIVLLSLSSATLVLAALLSVHGPAQVVVPGVGMALPELCMLRRTWGIDCPGCGLTRCFIALAHGDIRSAWSYNPAGIWFFVIVAFQIPLRALQLWRIGHGRAEIMLSYTTQIALGLFAAGLLVQWALRLAGMQF